MNRDEFKYSTTGRIIRTLRDYEAFVPNPVPRSLTYKDTKIKRMLGDAERTLGKLGGIGYLVPNPDFLIIPYTGREALASSRIEGTQASLSELFYFEAAEEKRAITNDLLEVSSYVRALNYGIERLKTLPLSLRLIREVHEKLMSGMRGGSTDKTPGEFRKSQNWIGGHNLLDATYVPPPVDEMKHALDDWERFIHETDHDLTLIEQLALLHYQFEAIHPFLDGNGRVGRLLITLFLVERNALPYPLLYLSHYFEQNRREYYDRLLGVSQIGDWENWVKFFMEGVIRQSDHAIESARRIVDQREVYRKQIHSSSNSTTTISLVDLIFTNFYITARKASHLLGKTIPTVQTSIDKLMQLGILEEITGKQRNRVYVASELMRLISDNEPLYRPK